MICFHRWTKWKVIEESFLYMRKWVALEHVKEIVGRRIIQQRNCEKCGKIQRNTLDSY
jgi:hypothetical protein